MFHPSRGRCLQDVMAFLQAIAIFFRTFACDSSNVPIGRIDVVMLILGLMSGTSLDGVDMALCDIEGEVCRTVAARTVPYPAAWRQRLEALTSATALDYALAHVELGHFFGQCVNGFLAGCGQRPEAVASHGHTVFHQPSRGLTAQIGDPDAIAAETGLPVVANFRALDVALGGQGAPLVPIGDELLYGQYDACLNLGGIANISYRHGGRRVAYDICPCNMALNRLASRLGLDFDPDGDNASQGRLHPQLADGLDAIPYYHCAPPKSLGKEWFEAQFWPRVEAAPFPVADLLRTVVEHEARQIARVLAEQQIRSLLATGGGAHNAFLIARIAALAPRTAVHVPDDLTVDYKEAIVFALLGYLRLQGRANTLASVTGARCNSVGGSVSGIPLP